MTREREREREEEGEGKKKFRDLKKMIRRKCLSGLRGNRKFNTPVAMHTRGSFTDDSKRESEWIEIDSNAVTHDRDAARVKYLYKADDVRLPYLVRAYI